MPGPGLGLLTVSQKAVVFIYFPLVSPLLPDFCVLRELQAPLPKHQLLRLQVQRTPAVPLRLLRGRELLEEVSLPER